MQLDVDSVRTVHSPLVLKEAVLESVGAKEKPEPSNDVPKKEIPIIELIRRIVTNDDLEEPRRLFGETMGLKEYGVYQMKWGGACGLGKFEGGWFRLSRCREHRVLKKQSAGSTSHKTISWVSSEFKCVMS
ncbi:hypothetical protein [Variovorax boronicumulans]|uniref:hypothetical protein n=1 Tax=Variovorax boronicumulans TaxID=436515 RepID=UPI001C5A38FF